MLLFGPLYWELPRRKACFSHGCLSFLPAASVESTKVLAQLDEDTMVLNQVYKRVQPAAPRDCTFLSHLRHIEGMRAHDHQCITATGFPSQLTCWFGC
jgi:hypothetical protein